MQIEENNITLLCKVVDNYGDIGFVYRLSRSLQRLNPQAKLRLVVSNLESFSRMAHGIDPSKPHQFFCGWEVLDWNNSQICTENYKENPPQIILECFQCGRPEWLDEILFAPDRTQTVQIINVEYLTAEEWADDFHLLRGATRSKFVKKMNFMPGFTSKTGGLVLDQPFMGYLENRQSALDSLSRFLSPQTMAEFNNPNHFNILFFSYIQDCAPLVEAIHLFMEEKRRTNPDFNLKVLAASGMSYNPFLQAYSHLKDRVGNTFDLEKLPYLEQDAWDALVTLTDFNFIRGEDSFSRACLSGIPFAWHVYVQDEEFQLVKLDAFLDRMEPFVDPQLYSSLRKFSFLYNRTPDAPACEEVDLAWRKTFALPGMDATFSAADATSASPAATFTAADATSANPAATSANPDATSANPDATFTAADATSANPDATSTNPDAPSAIEATPIPAAVSPTEAAAKMTSLLLELLLHHQNLKQSFTRFSHHLISNGDLAQHLLDYIATLV